MGSMKWLGGEKGGKGFLSRAAPSIPDLTHFMVAKNGLQVLRGEVVVAPHVIEALNGVLSFAVLDEHDRRHHEDVEPLHQERTLFCIDLDKLGLVMLHGQDLQMLVDDLTPPCDWAVEVCNHALGPLGLVEEVLRIGDLAVHPMACHDVLILLLLVLLHLLNSPLPDALQFIIVHLINRLELVVHLLLNDLCCPQQLLLQDCLLGQIHAENIKCEKK
mmetsp:Transcript_125430/g.217473  ORF Transcript_125430/g.217473 Transcript_125430/m.217473 type:complete len:217 (-) Transcript_125430:33-683(-)